jgi:hypothetical protein
MLSHPKYTKGPELADRAQRIGAARQTQAIKVRKAPKPGGEGGGI